MEVKHGVRARARAGMTLIEVMLASVLLAIGLLAMLALQYHAMRGSQLGRHYTLAAQLARDRMEDLHRRDWADVPVTAGWVADAPIDSTVQGEIGLTVEQSFNREVRVSLDPAGEPRIRQIDVRVTWYEPNDDPPPAAPRRRYAITSLRYNDGA
jgi:prepilin-type N-terminal cleavage/methylation domain-containing protein